VRVTKCPGGLRVAGATVITLCLAWCCTSCSPAASGPRVSPSVLPVSPSRLPVSPGRLPVSPSVASATRGKQLWASTLRDAGEPVEAVSPDGTRLFVSGQTMVGFETVAYSAATGAQLWARAYQPATSSNPTAIAVSPDGARVYVTGHTALGPPGGPTVAYDARTGKQLWASRASVTAYAATALAVSPDSATVYIAGQGGGPAGFAVVAYAAATGEQRWLRSYTKVKRGAANSVAVSPDGKTVYITGSGGPPYSVLTVAYQATGTVKWATRYKDPYADGIAGGSQIVAGPGGNAVYVVGSASNKSRHYDIATFAYGAATGRQLWLDRYNAHSRGGLIAVTPDGQTVILAISLSDGRTGHAALLSYRASTGETQWTAKAPLAGPIGLVIDPHGNTVIIGGNPITAYSVAHGTVLWKASYAQRQYPTAIALSGDGTRLFETGWNGRGLAGGIITVAYHT
jgi:outer membrane protein assembly factor BamB